MTSEAFRRCSERTGEEIDPAPPLKSPDQNIDAADILEDPEGVLSAYCERVGMPFDAATLSWEAEPVPELQSSWTGWTEYVQTSGQVRRRESRSEIPPEIVLARV